MRRTLAVVVAITLLGAACGGPLVVGTTTTSAPITTTTTVATTTLSQEEQDAVPAMALWEDYSEAWDSASRVPAFPVSLMRSPRLRLSSPEPPPRQ